MNLFSHFISILLSIGTFLGLPYNQINYQPAAIPTLTQPATTSLSNLSPFSPLLPTPFSTSTPQDKLSKSPTPTSTQAQKKQKLPTLALKAPTFAPLPLAKDPTQALPPTIPQYPEVPLPNPVIAPSSNPPPAAPVPATSTPPGFSPISISPSVSSITKSIVNVYCTTKNGNIITIITGSGVVIDLRGAILTNAHVADHVLLRDYLNNDNSNCYIRTGSPAVAAYKTALIYISPAWLQQHGRNLNNAVQDQETGEGDYALLIATEALNYLPLPQFSYLSPDLTNDFLHSASPLIVAGYGAGGLSGSAVMNNLMLKTDAPTLRSSYSFHANTIDLIGTGVTSVASRGSSGGAIINPRGQLLGLIATTVPDPNGTGEDAQALTLSYINADIKNNTGKSLAEFLNGNLPNLAASFKQSEPALFNYLPH